MPDLRQFLAGTRKVSANDVLGGWVRLPQDLFVLFFKQKFLKEFVMLEVEIRNKRMQMKNNGKGKKSDFEKKKRRLLGVDAKRFKILSLDEGLFTLRVFNPFQSFPPFWFSLNKHLLWFFSFYKIPSSLFFFLNKFSIKQWNYGKLNFTGGGGEFKIFYLKRVSRTSFLHSLIILFVFNFLILLSTHYMIILLYNFFILFKIKHAV